MPGQGDLFAGFSVPNNVEIPVPGTKERQRKSFGKLTLGELQTWFKDHNRDRAANVKVLAEVRKLINRVKQYMTADMTIEEGLAAAEAAQAKKDKAKQDSGYRPRDWPESYTRDCCN